MRTRLACISLLHGLRPVSGAPQSVSSAPGQYTRPTTIGAPCNSSSTRKGVISLHCMPADPAVL